jgi:hypothetical protein
MINIETGACAFPLCRTKADKGSGFCISHRKYFDTPNPKKSKQPIATESKKRKSINKQYKAIKKEMIGKDSRCKVKSPVCTGAAQGAHHLQKRSPSNLIAIDNLLPCCNACNSYLETNVKWSKDNNFSVSRFKKAM